MKRASHFSDLLSVDDLTALHRQAVSWHGGGGTGAKDLDCIQGSLGNAWTAEGYEEEEAKVPGLAFAGYALFYLARNHCFSDGNKRAAWLAAMAILGRLDLTVTVSVEEGLALVTNVITGAVPQARDVVEWLADRLEPHPR